MIRICFHGAESTGKSVLADRLGRDLGAVWVPEYGRAYCEERGIDLTMDDLLAIAEGHEAAVQAALANSPPLMLLDTDQLMTAAWAEMLFGEVPPTLLAYPKADLYLLFEADVPWVDDGTRFFGDNPQRSRFAALAEDMLVRAGVPWRHVSGTWNEREQQVRAIIAEALPANGGSPIVP